jgi:hypothetical protein
MSVQRPALTARVRAQGHSQVVSAAGGIEPQGDALANLCNTVCTPAVLLAPGPAAAPAQPALPPEVPASSTGLLI